MPCSMAPVLNPANCSIISLLIFPAIPYKDWNLFAPGVAEHLGMMVFGLAY